MSRADAQRLFFALNPRPDVRWELDQVRLRMGVTDARPVPTENLHITVVFLGWVENDQLDMLRRVISRIGPPNCDLYLDRCGWFKRPRVGWIGSDAVPDEALRFQQSLVHEVRALGFEFEDRPWKPHVTVYRKMRNRPVMLDFEPIRWKLDSYDLMVSEQRPGGVQYHSVGHRVANG